jgi:putative glutamine amidotransferase
MSKIIIGVTDCGKYNSYAKWIASDPEIEAVKLGYRENTSDRIKECHGIVLTGGEDVHPRFYKKIEYLRYCDKDDMDEKRDEFELEVIRYSQENALPVLGICRGLQIANVYFGGTLIPDIPTFGKFNHSKVSGYDLYHAVQVDPNSMLKKIVNINTGEVNSAHHQSAEVVAPDLVANAVTIDGVVEGIERLHPEGKPWLQLVQWHPERMNDLDNAFTKNIRRSFIDAVRMLVKK